MTEYTGVSLSDIRHCRRHRSAAAWEKAIDSRCVDEASMSINFIGHWYIVKYAVRRLSYEQALLILKSK